MSHSSDGKIDSRNFVPQPVALALTTVVIMASPIAGAADDKDARNGHDDVLEEVIVTGTRVIRDGYESPTPISVLGSDELDNMAVVNIADAVNRMPAFSRSSERTNSSVGGGAVSNLNLRGLGPVRTLVLLDGRRQSSGASQGSLDINSLPNGLISHVDVVTGGASAVYGSDALAGVVNFVLDKKFDGIRGGLQGGMTGYGDDETFMASLAGGTPFSHGRGHVLVSVEAQYAAGIRHNNRSWSENNYSMMVNPEYSPSNGEPQYIVAPNTGLATATPGGLITSGPLMGTMFLAGGTPAPFHYGPIVSGNMMSGGDWEISRIDRDLSMADRLQRGNLFSRASYELTNDLTVFGEFGWADTDSRNLRGVSFFRLGNITIRADNAFLPASVRERMDALGLDSFTLGTTNADIVSTVAGTTASSTARTFYRYVLGGEGEINLADTTWNWNAYYQRNKLNDYGENPNNLITANYNRAIDAVVNPGNGQIVCRSTLTDPTDGCVPYNAMGVGVNTAASVAYITGRSWSTTEIVQDVFAASASGHPFETWAGPAGIAFSVEHRKESFESDASPLAQAAAFFTGNATATKGSDDVTEGAVEGILPLANGRNWVESLELNTAARFTRYSTSGAVTTWKLGAIYKPLPDVALRVTRSRDIRAPNIIDLFSSGQGGVVIVNDNGIQAPVIARTGGNPNLEPEKADTTGFGVVFQPSFLHGFGASVDFYDINVHAAIVPLGAQTYVNGCNAGITALCSFIERGTDGVISLVFLQPVNIASQRTRGIDLDVSYDLLLSNLVSTWNGNLTFRGMATYVDSLKSTDPTAASGSTFEGAGVLADNAGIGAAGVSGFTVAPRVKYLLSATYERDAFSGTVTARGLGSGVYNHRFVECATGCPPSTSLSPTLGTSNHIRGITVYDLALQYQLRNDAAEVFFVVDNVFDHAPPRIGGAISNGFYIGQGNFQHYHYERIGRVFRAGVRIGF